MAHPNIDERRAAVAEALLNGTLSSEKKRQLAAQFGCSISAIGADVIKFNNSISCRSTYHVSAKMRRIIRERDRDICQYCGRKLEHPFVEHVLPAAQGGLATEENLVVTCQPCNMKKSQGDNDGPYSRSGRKLESIGRRFRQFYVSVTPDDEKLIRAMKPDQRREALLGYGIAKLAIIKALSALETNPVTGVESAWTILKVAIDRLNES